MESVSVNPVEVANLTRDLLVWNDIITSNISKNVNGELNEEVNFAMKTFNKYREELSNLLGVEVSTPYSHF